VQKRQKKSGIGSTRAGKNQYGITWLAVQEREGFTLDDEPFLLFKTYDQMLQEKILTLIPQLTREALPELKRLLNLISNFSDRITCLCNRTIFSFLGTLKEVSSPFPFYLSVLSVEQLVQKPGDEFHALCNSVMIITIEVNRQFLRRVVAGKGIACRFTMFISLFRIKEIVREYGVN